MHNRYSVQNLDPLPFFQPRKSWYVLFSFFSRYQSFDLNIKGLLDVSGVMMFQVLWCFRFYDVSGVMMFQVLWEKDAIWWRSNFLGLRGRDEHHKLRWWDITLEKDVDGNGYLQFHERDTKTRKDPGDTRPFHPKIFETPATPYTCPVMLYLEYKCRYFTFSLSPTYIGVFLLHGVLM